MLPPRLLTDDTLPIATSVLIIIAFQQAIASTFETPGKIGRTISALLLLFQIPLFSIALLHEDRRRRVPLAERDAPARVRPMLLTHAMIAAPNLMMSWWMTAGWGAMGWYALGHVACAAWSVLSVWRREADDEAMREEEARLGVETGEKAVA